MIASLYDKGEFSLAFLSDKGSEDSDLFVSPITKTSQDSPEIILIEDSSIKPVSSPTAFSPQVLGALVEGYEPEDVKNVITEYVVEKGDTLSLIASKFNISLNTLLWANDLSSGSLLELGQKLVISPVSGVIYHVKQGDTLSSIAAKYKATTSEIAVFNSLASEGDIYIGDILIVPNGKMPVTAVAYSAPALVPLANSYFICPITSCRVTQGWHFYNAIDFSNGKCGEAIRAAAEGTVVKVKMTSSTSRLVFGGAGNTIAILHPNGVITSYGHVAASLVEVGDKVSQGQMIALMGGQPGMPGAGLSTGCHVHFAVSGARNPFSR
jgi:murein DD-endopeptidase MepM/ murein hydrolase activator NlpD